MPKLDDYDNLPEPMEEAPFGVRPAGSPPQELCYWTKDLLNNLMDEVPEDLVGVPSSVSAEELMKAEDQQVNRGVTRRSTKIRELLYKKADNSDLFESRSAKKFLSKALRGEMWNGIKGGVKNFFKGHNR